MQLRERKKQAVREAILNAAEDLLRERGYRAVSMDEIAERAAIARKTLFNYMSSKNAIVAALIRRRFSAPITLPFAETPDLPTGEIEDILPPERERRLAALHEQRWLLRLGVEHTNLFSSDEDPELDEQLQEARAARIARIRRLQTLGKVRPDLLPEAVCWQFEVVRNAVFRRWLRTEPATLANLERDFDRAMRLFLHGVAN